LLFITANKVSDYCKLINEEDGHMGDTRVGVCETQKLRDTQREKWGERSGMPNLTLRVPDKMIVCVRENSCQIVERDIV
jgi:hypothetical protein